MKQLRNKEGRYTYNRPAYVKAITIFSIVGTLIGVGHSALREVSVGSNGAGASSGRNDGGPVAIPGNVQIDFKPCSSDEGGHFDCTDEATRAKLYETAKKGIKWYTKPETAIEKLSAVCEDQGIKEESCPKVLKAMATQESYFGKVMVGDGGRSHGWFHILNIHKDVSLACANDLTCSATWTLKRMVRNGYPKKLWWAVGTHNSYTPAVNKIYSEAIKKQLAKL